MSQLIVCLCKTWQTHSLFTCKFYCRLDKEGLRISNGAPIIEDPKPEDEVKGGSAEAGTGHHVTISAKESRSREGDDEVDEAYVHINYSVSFVVDM